MKNHIFRLVFFVLLLFIFTFLFLKSSKTIYAKEIFEEAIPIRDNDKIIGLHYKLEIDPLIDNKELVFNTSILSSIYHYKDISKINDFFVELEIEQNFTYPYKISNIYYVGDDIKPLNYLIRGNLVYIYFTHDDFVNYNNLCYVRLELFKE